jgi:integrase
MSPLSTCRTVLVVLEQKVLASKGYPAGTFWTARAVEVAPRAPRRARAASARAAEASLPRGRQPAPVVGARNEALGDATMSATLRRLGCNATVHGMRSAFSTWAHEQSAHSNHVIEMALAHAVHDIEKIYRRTDLFNKRRKLMEQWATYCCSPSAVTGAVVRLHSA